MVDVDSPMGVIATEVDDVGGNFAPHAGMVHSDQRILANLDQDDGGLTAMPSGGTGAIVLRTQACDTQTAAASHDCRPCPGIIMPIPSGVSVYGAYPLGLHDCPQYPMPWNEHFENGR